MPIPRLLAITWGDGEEHVSEVRFEFTAMGEETHLKLTHTKIDSVVLRDRDANVNWRSASDGAQAPPPPPPEPVVVLNHASRLKTVGFVKRE